jgi:hypothetical protein
MKGRKEKYKRKGKKKRKKKGKKGKNDRNCKINASRSIIQVKGKRGAIPI